MYAWLKLHHNHQFIYIENNIIYIDSSLCLEKSISMLTSCRLFLDISNSLPDIQVIEQPKLKAFAEDKILKNVTEKSKFVFGRAENILGKVRKCWAPSFSPFPRMFSKHLLLIQGCEKLWWNVKS